MHTFAKTLVFLKVKQSPCLKNNSNYSSRKNFKSLCQKRRFGKNIWIIRSGMLWVRCMWFTSITQFRQLFKFPNVRKLNFRRLFTQLCAAVCRTAGRKRVRLEKSSLYLMKCYIASSFRLFSNTYFIYDGLKLSCKNM